MTKPIKIIKNRQVWGPSGEVGYIVKTPGHGKLAASKIEERTLRGVEDALNREERERMRNDVYMKDFWVSSDKHCLNSRIERFVDFGMKSYEVDLQHKKNKLKVMMLDEQSNLTREYIDKAQKSAALLFEAKVKRAQEIVSQQADAQRSFVQEAYERIFQDNCDELRTKTTRENRLALNKMHEVQMCERLWADQLALEEEQIWSAMENQADELMNHRSKNEASENTKHCKEYAESLDQQMKVMNLKRQNERCVDQIEESFRQEYQRRRNEELESREVEAIRKREINAIELVDQLEANRLLREKRREEETYFDRILIEDDRKAAEKDQLAIVDNRAQLRCELSIFRESLKQYNDSLAANEKDMERIREEFKKEHEQKQLAVKRESAKARRDLLSSCLEVRKEQVAHRKAQENNTKELDSEEAEYLRFRQAQSEGLDVMRRRRDLEDSQKACEVIRECEKYGNVKRERERLRESEFNNERIKEYEEMNRKTNEILRRPVQTTGTGLHPFLGPLLSND